MKGNTWNNIVKPIVVLGAICLVASAALAAVNEVTAPIIKAQEEAAANEAYFAVLPEADGFEAVTDYQTSNIQAVMKATNGAGWAIQAYGKGFGGDVPVTVTVKDGKISDVTVGDNSETQGIGSNAIEQLPSKIVEANGTDGVDDVSGATITSKAIKSAVNDALAQGK